MLVNPPKVLLKDDRGPKQTKTKDLERIKIKKLT